MNYTTSPAFTLAKTYKTNILQMPDQDYCSPGPMYNTFGAGKKLKSTAHKIGNSRRTQINHWVEVTPSPNKYNKYTVEKSHPITIPQAKIKTQISNNPEPGYYKPQHSKVKPKSPKYSLGARYCSIMDQVDSNPGVGKYSSHANLLISSKAISIGKSGRFQSPNNHPGVGDYNIANKNGLVSGKGTMDKSQREPIKKPDIPGPTNYQKKSAFQADRKIGKTISMKLQGCFDNNNLTIQAFNKYSQYSSRELKFKKSAEFSIGNQKRQIFVTQDIPGPSDYNTNAYNQKSTFHASIPKSLYEPYNELIDVPGPGRYKIEQQTGPKFTIQRAKSATIVRNVPGVGRYNTQGIQSKRAQHAIPKSARTNFVSKNLAGVGDYNIQKSAEKPKGTIGKSVRFKKIQKLPGPGDYHVQSIIGYKSRH